MSYLKELFSRFKLFVLTHKKIIGVGFLIIFLLHDAAFAYNNLQNKTPILGLRFENHFLFGLKYNDLDTLIQKEALSHNRPLLLGDKGKVIKISQTDVGYRVNSGYLANKLLSEGRTGTIFQRFFVQEKALLGLGTISISGTVSKSLLTLKIIALQTELDTNPQPISLDFVHDFKKIIPAQDGKKIQVDKLSLFIINNISNPPPSVFPVPFYTAFVNHHDVSELIPIQKQAVSFFSTPVGIVSGGISFILTSDDLKQMAVVVERPNPKNHQKTTLSLRIDDTKLNQRLGVFAGKVESITHAEFDDHEARVALYAQLYNPQSAHFLSIPTGQRLSTTHVLGTSSAPGPKIAYLTFDDGPNSLYHPMILDILHAYNVQATFFLVGKNVPSAHEAALATVKGGYLIGNHSFTHSFLPNLSNASILDELSRTDNILQSITYKPTLFFRPPYGGVNQYVISDAHELGLRIFLWDVDPRDWSEPSTDDLVQRVVGATHNGSNILLHSNHLATVKALPRIIETLQNEGYTFSKLDQYPQPEEL
ncbi:MAG TPA: polysaccharide deacetylase family protein [Patescibacteria group bacterium]|nr:polysaccharide deacetylase family protein [Patescibacteria group bacterium]